MNENTPIYISDLTQLKVLVYLIGYFDQGESVIILLQNGEGKVLYSLVVDSYEVDGINKTTEILDAMGAKPIDVLCWTHPDADHSIGPEKIIAGFCNKKSQVLLPYGLVEGVKIKDLGDVAPVIKQVFDLGNQMRKPVCSVAAHLKQYNLISRFSLIDGFDRELSVTIRALAPNNEYILDKIVSKGEVEKNDLSVVLVIDIGPYRFLLTGDAEKMMINKMSPKDYQDPIWVKIPHHSSTSSANLVDFLLSGNSTQVLSGTTMKKASALPHPDVIGLYKGFCAQVNATGSLLIEPTERYGMVTYCFDLFGTKTVRIHCDGNAVKL